jgi:hypothetical protein
VGVNGQAEKRIANAAATSFILLVMAQVFGLSCRFYVSSPFAVHTAYYCLTQGVFPIARWFLVGSTRIVLFRRYASTNAPRHRSTILPIAGALGYLDRVEHGVLFRSLLSRAFVRWEPRAALPVGRNGFDSQKDLNQSHFRTVPPCYV